MGTLQVTVLIPEVMSSLLIKPHEMKMYDAVKEQLHAFLTSATARRWLVRFTPRPLWSKEGAWIHQKKIWVDSSVDRVLWREKSLLLARIEPPFVGGQPATSALRRVTRRGLFHFSTQVNFCPWGGHCTAPGNTCQALTPCIPRPPVPFLQGCADSSKTKICVVAVG